jgi:FAD/FMN-containing dehydrogenase
MERRTFIRSTVAAAAALSVPKKQSLAALYRTAHPHRLPEDVLAVTGDGKPITLTGKAIDDLRARLRGRVLLATDQGYDDARRILNPSFDKRPALIAQVTGAADVRTAVDFARENQGLLLAVKCGGHSFSGQSTCDRGMMIDLSGMRHVRVDPAAKRAWVAGGSLLGHVDHETMSHGLVTPLGTVSHTGVGGLVTGGGFGRVARRFGLSVDNVLAVDIVTADGQLRHASKDENPDLYWGVRGGGGNFGIVTSFEFQLHPMSRQVIGGTIMYPLARAKDALSAYMDYAPRAPDELNLECILMQPPGSEPGLAGFTVCYSGPPSGAERALAPIRKLGTPLADDVRATDYVAIQKSGDISDPRAVALYLKSGFVGQIRPDLVSAIVSGFKAHPGRITEAVLVPHAGAIGRTANEATAFAHRGALASLLVIVGWPSGSNPTEHVDWIKQYWATLEPFTEGFYINDLAPGETRARLSATFGKNYDRLVGIKNKHDPRNLFRLNANVTPTV